MEPWVILGGSCITEKPTLIWAVTLGSYVSRVSSVTWRQLHQRRFFSCLLLLWPQGRSLWVLCQESCEFCKLEALMSLIISFSPSRKKRRECFSLGKQTLYYWLSKAWQAQEYTENSFKKINVFLCVCVNTHVHALWVYGYMCAMAHIWSQKTVLRCLFHLVKSGYLLFLQHCTYQAMILNQFSCCCAGVTDVSQHIWLFTWVLSIGFGLSDLHGKFFLPAKPPPHLPFGTFLLVSYCLQHRGLEYFGYKH